MDPHAEEDSIRAHKRYKTKEIVGDIVFIGLLNASWVGAHLSGHVSIPENYLRVTSDELKNYKRQNIEVSMKPVFVEYGLPYNQPLGISLLDGIYFIKAKASRIDPPFFGFKLPIELSKEKQEEVYNMLRRIISSGNTKSITIRGKFNGEYLEAHSVTIDDTVHSLLQK